MGRHWLSMGAFLGGALIVSANAGLAAAADAPGCRDLVYRANTYVVCEVDLRQQRLKLFWKQANGKRYGTLWNVAFRTRGREGRMMFAMNAGMYSPERAPLGLYVENGRQLVAANTASDSGNFFLKPNGVFFVRSNRAGIAETGQYLQQRLRPDLATQSGPMLVIDGRLHPKFAEQGASRNIRNGVGVIDEHRVVFAISKKAVSFGDFARLFRDHLRCANALYLDGRISGLYAPLVLHKNVLMPMGPIIGAFGRK